MSTSNTTRFEGIAIIGMAGRFPGARDLSEYWRNLQGGVEAITFFTDEELKEAGVDPVRLSAPNFIKAKGVLEDGDKFDAAFFGFTPREAEIMDPQHRVFMECVWSALESAGYDPEAYEGAIGLYGGASMDTYLLFNLMSNRDLLESVGLLQASVHNRTDHLTTHVAYELNLKGPSLTIQTACSTSLVALHTACQSLLSYECDMALAGGVSVTVPLKNGYTYQEGGIYSPDGHCRAFDERAQGTVEGNGVGVVVLKRLEEALADGDYIHAVIRGSAVNNDGSLKVGYTAPGVDGQAEVITEAHAISGVAPETISYVETHGTGTTLGDPVEIEALTQAFRQGTDAKRFCRIGSVKTNIGHLDAAAGIAGLIKTALALKHRQLPPSLNFERENARIDFANSPFLVNAELTEWETAEGQPRRAGVSSFGIGGTNAHVVLEEAPEQTASVAREGWQLLPLSARTGAALDTATLNLHAYLKENPSLNLADVAHTLQSGRRAFNHRRVVICRDMEDAVRALETLDARRVFTSLQEPRERPVAFMFPGQGAQYARMGAELYRSGGVFREEVDRCSELLRQHLGFDLREALYPVDEQLEEASRKLQQTETTQPALFVIEYALARQWMEWGVKPQAMIGHSIGEYVAACLAGVFSLEDALRLVAARGRLMQGLPGGSMLVVPLAEQRVRAMLAEREELSLAAVNAPALCVVSGTHEAIDRLEAELKAEGHVCRRLHTSHAFHSRMMDPILAPFAAEVARTNLSGPSIPYISNVTGTWITPEEATDPDYWTRHLRQTVLFGTGAGELFRNPENLLVEVGPGRTLSVLARQHPHRGPGQMVLSSLRHADEREPDEAFMLSTLGRLWLANVPVDWAKLSTGELRRRVPLPTYPFERQRYWIDAQTGQTGVAGRGPLQKNPNLAEWFYAPSWRRSEEAPAPPTGALARESRRWLLFMDECGLGAGMRERLTAEGQEVIAVAAGAEFRRTGAGAYVIRPEHKEDYQALLKDIGAAGDASQTIVHLWNVTEQLPAVGAEERATTLGFHSLLYLAQALGEQLLTLSPAEVSAESGLNICVVSNHLHEVTGEEELCPEKATLLGPCRVISQEYQNIICRSIDVMLPPAGSKQTEKLIADLLAEATAVDDRTAVVAYRGRHRWVQDFTQLRLDEAEGRPASLRDEGVYLVTGGLGGIGLELARYLAAAARARLVLVGRTPMPAREEWDGWLATHGEGDEIGQRILKLRAIEEAGGQVFVAAADVADEAQMSDLLAEARRRFGPINGVIHAAGVPGGGIIQLKTEEMAARVLAPKVAGTRVLERLLADEPLDFFVMCSSRSSVLGGFGNVDYCAANAFLDAFAHYRRAQGDQSVISIDWDAWQAVGMLVKTAARVGAAASPARAEANGNPSLHGNANGNGHRSHGHPLLHRRIEEGTGAETYATEFSVAEHWVLDDHRIVGTAVMPGTAYLEMARAAVEAQGQPERSRMLEIRDAFFLAPLALRDDEKREVRTTIERDGDEFSFRVQSRPTSAEGASDEWQTFSIGKIGYVEPEPPARVDLKPIIERCNLKEIVIKDDDELDPDLGPRWQSLRRVYLGDRELLATLELPEVFDADMEQLKLHPALLDRATGTAKHYLVNEGHYLPMGYKRLRIKGPLPRKVYTYIKFNDGGFTRNETITFDIILLDEEGVERVVIESFSQKRVNDATGTIKMLAGTPQRRAEQAASGNGANETGDAGDIYQHNISGGVTPEEGVEAFRRVLAKGTLAQVIVSTKDLSASIEQVNSFTQTTLTQEAENIRAARPAHPRPDLQTPYVAPRNEVERQLAAIWQEMLGIDRVSVHDNFFELGGDSVQAIQISAKVNEAGLQFTPQQLFQNQTIAELAALLDPSAAAVDVAAGAGEEAAATGEDWGSTFQTAGLSSDELAKIALLIDESDQSGESAL
jgi:phthiocerol/phenolphthiocerol synthesis type-I polyketide synthase E